MLLKGLLDAVKSCGTNCYADPKLVPSHTHSHRKADIVFDILLRDGRKVVGDVTVCHPVSGTTSPQGQPVGTWKPRVMSDRFSHKNTKHSHDYSIQNLCFVPLVASTFGVLNDEFLRLLWLATSNARGSGLAVGEVRESFGSTQRQMLFSKLRSRVSVLAARSCAMRFDSFAGVHPFLADTRHYNPSDPFFLFETPLVGPVIGPLQGLNFRGGG